MNKQIDQETKRLEERRRILQKCKELNEEMTKNPYMTDDEKRIVEITKEIINERAKREEDTSSLSEEENIKYIKEKAKVANAVSKIKKQKTIFLDPKKNGNGEV